MENDNVTKIGNQLKPKQFREVWDVAAFEVNDNPEEQVGINAALEQGYEPFSVVVQPIIPKKTVIETAEKPQPRLATMMWLKCKKVVEIIEAPAQSKAETE